MTFSCYHGHQFLQAEQTCQWLVDAIDMARQELDVAIWAYVVMPEHAHIVVWPRCPGYDIASIRKAIKSPVGRKAIQYLSKEAPEWLPRITRTRGNKTERLFWQSGGGYDRNIDEPATLANEIEYIHLNPVRRGLVELPEQWKWSSAAWYTGECSVPLVPDPIHPEWIT